MRLLHPSVKLKFVEAVFDFLLRREAAFHSSARGNVVAPSFTNARVS